MTKMVCKKYFEESVALLRRCRDALNRTGWEEGETDAEVVEDIDSFLDCLELSEAIEKEMRK